MEKKNVYLTQLSVEDSAIYGEGEDNYRYIRPTSLEETETIDDTAKLIIDSEENGANSVKYPHINGIPLVGNKTSEELGLSSGGSGEEPIELPKYAISGTENNIENEENNIYGNNNNLLGLQNSNNTIIGSSNNINNTEKRLLFSITNLKNKSYYDNGANGILYLTVEKQSNSQVIFPNKKVNFDFPVMCCAYLEVAYRGEFDDEDQKKTDYYILSHHYKENDTELTFETFYFGYGMGIQSAIITNINRLDFYAIFSSETDGLYTNNKVYGNNNQFDSKKFVNNIVLGSNNYISGEISNSVIEGSNHKIYQDANSIHLEGDETSIEHYYDAECCHVEGYMSKASGRGAHAEGSIYKGRTSFAIGEAIIAYGTTARGEGTHAEGLLTFATGDGSHTEGYNTYTSESAKFAHAEGLETRAHGEGVHAEGYKTTAEGSYCHAEGVYTKVYEYAAHGCGKFNNNRYDSKQKPDIDNQLGNVFYIGNGTPEHGKQSNALRVTYAGEVLATSAFQSSGADYAEYIYEWEDKNLNNEDRIGYFVTVKGKKLHIATSKDVIVGVTSGNPSVIGNSDEDYVHRYERDEFNRIVWEDTKDEEGNVIPNSVMKLSESYNPELQKDYIPRAERSEWTAVGMVGVLPVRDDGTCVEDEWCVCNDSGIATHSDSRTLDSYLVLERVNDHVIKVLLK